MRRQFLRIPIGFRLGVGVLLIQLILIAWMTLDSRHVALDALERQQQLRIAELTTLLNDALAPLLVQRDYAALQDVLDNVGRAEGIDYLLLHDSRGRRIASYGWDVERVAPPVDSEFNGSELSADSRFDTRVPIHMYGQQYGELQLGISTRVFVETWQYLLSRGLRNALVGLVLLLLVVVPISFCLSRRLGKLNEVADAIAQGELERRLEDRSQDELGRLAEAFNSMAGSLQQRMQELEQLGEAREKVITELARANRDLQRLSEVAAHHMREPLRRLITYSQRLHQQCASLPDSEAISDSLSVVEQQSRQMAALIRDVERYLSAGQVQGELTCLDPSEMLRTLHTQLSASMEQREGCLQLDVLPCIHIDRPRLHELLEVLLSNAFNHAHTEQPPQIQIGAESLGAVNRFYLGDNGQGIPQDYRERVFAIFERLDRVGEGTGIGLSIARRIVESLDGRIWIEEGEQGGCRVVFELPNCEGGKSC